MAKPSMPIQVAVFVVAVAVIVGWSYLTMRKQSSGGVDEDADGEPDFPTVVAAARAANPTLSFEPGSTRSPEFFVVRERASGRQAQLPSGELAGAKIRFVECDLGSVAPGLVYPNRSETTCLELRNDRHAMSAYAFASPDDLERLLAFFELNVAPEYRLGLYKNRKETLVTRTRRKAFTHEFIVSYMLWSGGGFVGYREEKAAPASR
jgi:hypothetical protein